jgi:hypothetical protein
MSAIFGAIAVFYALAFMATMLALAADSRPALWPRGRRAATYPAFNTVANSVAAPANSVDEMSDDERILTTPVAATAAARTAQPSESADSAVRAA